MKNKKLILTISVISFVLIVSFVITYNLSKNTNNYLAESKPKNSINDSFLTLMLEQSDGTYAESTSNTWPGDGYIFNKELSSCQNGGELSWNDELGAVTLHSNKSDSCYVYFDMYIIPVINSVTTSNIETDSITLTVNVTNGNNPVTTYYYSNNNGNSYVSSNSNTYTFSGLDMGTEYSFSIYLEDSEGYKSEVYTLSEATDDTVLLADWVISQYGGVQGNNGIYYHTSSLANSAGDNSYRYAGANPNNYVCFGSNASTCPSDNLYRIIGVFRNEVKLIKNTSIGNYAWDADNVNTWDALTKPDIYYTLNTTYLSTLGNTWSSKIVSHNYEVGGMSWSNGISTPRTAYNYEVGSNQSGYVETMKIGLMYVSDYGFAASNTYWSTHISSYDNATGSNWLYLGSYEWTISRDSVYSTDAWYIYSAGYLLDCGSVSNEFIKVRPVFYLSSSVQYSEGDGTQENPIRLAI